VPHRRERGRERERERERDAKNREIRNGCWRKRANKLSPNVEERRRKCGKGSKRVIVGQL